MSRDSESISGPRPPITGGGRRAAKPSASARPRAPAGALARLGLLLATAGLGSAVLFACGRPAPDQRNAALYVTMRDGVRIAIDVWLPGSLLDGERIPAIMRATRYWRARDRVGVPLEESSNYGEAERFNRAGYALVLVDARGSGASFGVRRFELAEDEVEDYGEIVDWIEAQPWSNGRVGAYGVSYAGNTAEMLAVNMHPAVKAVAPLFNDFDNFGHLVFPGGILTVGFLQNWSDRVRMRDLNDICALEGETGADCEALRQRVTGVKPVDDDSTGELLAAAVREHEANTIPFESALEYEYRDDPFGPYGERHVGHRRSPSGHLPRIDSSAVAMLIRAGWLDAGTVNGTLGRFNTISNPQRVLIGPWDHGARNDADPFLPPDTPVRPSVEEQHAELVAFFDVHLQEAEGPAPPGERSLSYYTLGSGEWTTTDRWPPAGFEMRAWHLGPGGTLIGGQPAEPETAGAETADRYVVDFSATTGTRNRWYTNGGAGDVVYPDRAEEDRKLLTYTSPPLETDIEITGHPLVTLYLMSTEPDGAFIVYLEDVAPDGRVTYITEGQLRGVMRRTTDAPPLYRKHGPHRSELRADALPLVPGEVAEISFDLWATSVLIRRGHRIRVALAGADADTFLRYPRNGAVPILHVQRGRTYPSRIELPMRER